MCRKFSFLVSFVLVLCLVGNTWGVIANQDIGSTGIAGSASEAAGVWTVEGSGADIWGGSDAFHYVYRPMSGDGILKVNVTSMTDPVPDGWTKVGVMIRETLAANSKHAMVAITGVNGCQFVWREDTGGSSSDDTTGGQVLPKEMWIEREGDTLRGRFWKWEILGIMGNWVSVERTISMNEDVYIGLVVCSHNDGLLCTAEFEGPGTYIDEYTPPTPNPGSPVEWPAAPYEKAWMLSPEDGAMNQPLQPTLTWMPGDSATSHDVYLGTNPTPTDEPSVDTKALGDESYTPDPLAEGTMYYWQIVEQPLGEESAIMSFKTERIGTGSIDLAVWDNMGGGDLNTLKNDLRYPDSPTWTGELTMLDTTESLGNKTGIWDNYGGRMIGQLVPETSGDYTFWIASDDASELWLSTSGKACEAVMLCKVSGWTGYHNYEQNPDTEPDQESAPVYLEGGQKYPIWALWKEGGGGDHCSVAWEGPDAPSRTEIDGYFLMPGFVDDYPSNPNPADGATLTVQEATTVSWKAGGTATSHNVYLGEDPGAMALIATVAMPDTSAALPLAVDTTYYWMVEADDGTNTYTGCTQSFSTVEWVSMDIATSGGSATQTGDCWTIVADGGDIWDGGDRFHFVYKTPKFTRDEGTIIAHVMSVANVGNEWAKAGVMIRETTDSGSKNTAMLTTPATWNQRATFQWREQTNEGSGGSDHGDVLNPEWVKLVRNGNTFSGYHSDDGVNWDHHGDHTVEMNSFVRVGLAVTSHIDGVTTTAEICDVSITTPDPRQAWNYMPQCGATGVSIHPVVKWNAGDGVALHRVYFGADEAAVMARTELTAELPGDVTECDPIGTLRESLMLAETYYWVVDSVMPDGTVIPGEICSFTAEEYRLVDDFESYDVVPEPLPLQVMTPGEIVVEAVPPPDQTEIVAGYTIPGYTVEAVAPDAGCLLADWAFEGDYTDSASGFNGTPVGNANIVTDAERGQVLSLGGDMDYVDCGNPAALNFSTGDWTLSAWVKNTMTGTGDTNKGSIIANGGDGGGGHRYCLVITESDEGRVTLVTDDNSKKRTAKGGTNVNDDVWHHVLGVRDGGKVRLYIDGVEDASADINEDLSGASQANVLIGAITLASDGSIYKTYAGLIDDARIYNCALTEGNARYLAGIGDLVIDPIVVPPVYGPLLIHWAFDEGAGDVAADSSGNGKDGAISNAAWTAVTADGSASCLDFEAGSNVVNTATGSLLNGLNAMTISLWVQSDDVDTDQGFLIFADPAGNDERGMRYDKAGASGGGTNVIKYGISTDVGSEQSESSANVQTTEWQHIIITWVSGAGTKLYLNGVYNSPGYDGADIAGALSAYNKMIVGKGGKDAAADASWDGRIDDVRIYNYVVSEGEVRYLAGLGNMTLPDRYEPLLAHYDFEAGDGTDSSGNNLHADLNGNAMVVDDALIGSKVLDVDANATAETHMNCGNSDLFDTLDDQMTIATWIRIRDFGGAWTKLISNGNTSSWRFEREGSTGAVSFPFDGTNPNGRRVGDMNIDDGQWHHICAVLNSPAGYSALLVDGIVDDYGSAGGNCNTNDNEIRVGDHQEWHDRTNGWFDDVRIYNSALTLGQVRTLANYDPPNPIEGTWTGRGAASPKLDYAIAHGGSQSMRVEYIGDGAVSRLEPFRDGQDPHEPSGDWTLGGAKALVIYFRGDPDNAPGQMFAQLTTTVPSAHTQRVMYDGDPEDLLIPEWIEWNIELHDLYTGKPFDPPLPDEGLPATKIKSVGVGIIGGGSGVLHFDDIRTYPTRCVAQYAPQYDITGDCIVNEDDLRVLIGDWLDGDKTELGLVARFEFDGDLSDSSGNGNHGTAHGAVGFETDALMGEVLSLPGGDDQYVSIPPVGLSGSMPTTITCWAKTNTTDIPDWTLVFGFSTEGGDCGSHFNIGNIGGPGGIGAHLWCFEATIFTDEEALEWRHYAMTYDGTTMSYYGDGVLIGTVDYDLWRRGDRVNVGKRNTQASSFNGKVDDARIYNRELSTAEINTVMSGAEIVPVYTPLVSAANLYDEEPVNSKKINFKDYALLLQQWLDEIYWP